MEKIRIKGLLNKKVITADQNENLKSIISLMNENGVNHIPIVNEEGLLVGILSKHDIYRNLLKLSMKTTGETYSEISLNTVLAKEIMTMEPVRLSPQSSVNLAAEILMQGRFHAVPVVENERIVGIVTSKDILQLLTKKIPI